jgi:hypothetical protein
MDSVKVTATQKEAAGLAYHFAARIAHLRTAIGAIAGKIRLPCGLGRNLCSWIGLAFIGHRCSTRSVTPNPRSCTLKPPCNSSGTENISLSAFGSDAAKIVPTGTHSRFWSTNKTEATTVSSEPGLRGELHALGAEE